VTPLDIGLKWASAHVPAFPIAIAWDDAAKKTIKRPLTVHGHKSGTTNPDELRALFAAAHPRDGEVLAVGLWPGPGGEFVIDVDVKGDVRGDDTLQDLEAEQGSLPDAPLVTTASGGWHLWFAKPDGAHTGNTHSLGDGVDIRSDDGWVVAPGVVTPWGSWTHDEGTPRKPPKPPSWITDRLTHRNGQHASHWRSVDADELSGGDKAAIAALQRLGGHDAYRSDDSVVITRPGKTAGASASVGYIAPGIVKVFTPNWPPLQDVRVYDADELTAIANGAAPDAKGDQREDHSAAQTADDSDTEDTDAADRAFPEPEPEDTATLLDDTHRFIRRFIVCSEAGLVAGTLWTAHTHAFDAAEYTPRLSIRSPEAESGKTRFLEVLKLLVRAPLLAVEISDAAMFRVVEARKPSVLHDEIDAVFGPKARDREDLRAMLNAGYERGATVPRCVGEGSKLQVKEFQVFAPVALAGLGKLPYTLETRSIIVRMKPRIVDEKIQRLRKRKIKDEAARLRGRWDAWAQANTKTLTDAEPELPDELSDRAQDIWEPLLAVSDLAGKEWAERARAAAKELFAARGEDDESIGRRLLADARAVFDDPERDDPVDEVHGQAITSGGLAAALAAIEGAPWDEWSKEDKPITGPGLAPRKHPGERAERGDRRTPR
jgi:hypothetical protein